MGASACSRARVETVNSQDVEIKDGQGNVLRSIKLETKRPDFLADAIPCTTRSLQGSDPTQWAMTNVQLLEFFNYIRPTPEYEAAKEARGHVCLYDVNSLFVIPWSRGFSCGVALLMNAHAPLKAQVMISHAWAEDVEELVNSLSSWASRIQLLWASDGVPLWCCTFAQYQPEDGAGPSLQHQLSLDPFKSVIHSEPKHGMLVVHTTKADPYDRLWCVHEVDEALDSELFVTAIGTRVYSRGDQICTRRAKCGHPADEKRIRRVIESKAGGYERLDRAIEAFRNTLLKSGALGRLEIQVPLSLLPCSGRGNRLFVNLEHYLKFGVGRKDLCSLLTLTDSDGCEIPFELFERDSERDVGEEFPVDPVPCLWECIPKQPLAQQQFPLKMTWAASGSRPTLLGPPQDEVASGGHTGDTKIHPTLLSRRYCPTLLGRCRLPQDEVASGSHTIEKVFENEKREREWNEMKLHHPVLRGQWISSSLHAQKSQERIGNELLEILRNATENADLFRCDFLQRDLSHWSVYLKGPEGTPYDCGWFAAGIEFSKDHPFKPPKIKIFTKILHPNIRAESGEVCLDILREEWSPGLYMSTVLKSVLALLAAPEPQDAVNVEAAALLWSHPELFAEKARLWTRTYALPEPLSFRDLGYALPEPPSFRDLGIGTLLSL